jgi:hypothetical protein
MEGTDLLISALAERLRPVRRLPSPLVRAALWLSVVAALSLVLVLSFADLATFARRAAEPKFLAELAGTLATGILAVVAAFALSLPDRPLSWALLPAPTFLLWVASSSYSCWVSQGPHGYQPGEGPDCFAWIVGLGIPLGLALFVPLRRAQPLNPAPVAAMAGLGVASIAAFLLQFFHPFDVTFIDLGLHLAAVAAVVVLARAAAQRGLG